MPDATSGLPWRLVAITRRSERVITSIKKRYRVTEQPKTIKTAPLHGGTKKVIAARPRGNPSYCHPTRVVRQPQQAQRRAPSVGGTLQFGILLSDGLVVGHWLTWPGAIASHPVTSYQTPHCRGVRAFGRGGCSCLFAGRLSKRHRLSCSGSDEALMLFPTFSLHIATTDPSV